MDSVTAVRAFVPVAKAGPQAATPDHRTNLRRPDSASAPVSQTLLADAAHRQLARPSSTDPQFLAARDTVDAAATAEAARAAYIKASIAAGISPLPLP